MTTYILYHDNCPDGFGAAFAAWKKLGDSAKYLPVNHSQPVPDLKNNSEVYLVDFCYPKETLLGIVKQMKKVTVLDHHKTAEADLQQIDLQKYPSLAVTFDMDKSGAVLAWEHFHYQAVPELLYYIQDKDLWRFELPHSKEFSAALRSYEMDFQLWDGLAVQDLIREGQILLRYQDQLVNKLCSEARVVELNGYQVPVVNSGILQSEIGNSLCKQFPQSPFAVVYYDSESERRYSLRSIGEFDVSAVAKTFGGGGHKNASGFSMKKSFPLI